MKSILSALVLVVFCAGCASSNYTIQHYTCDGRTITYHANEYKVETSEFVYQTTEHDPDNFTLYYQTICKFRDLQNNCLTVICGDIKVVKN